MFPGISGKQRLHSPSLTLVKDIDPAMTLAASPSSIQRGRGRNGQAGRAGVDPYRDLPYWLVVLGDPTSTDPWAWRINGHHLLAQATVVGDQVNGVPHFFGAEPATVLQGPHAGLRALPREEELARELMLTLAGGPAADGADRGQSTRRHRLPFRPDGCATG